MRRLEHLVRFDAQRGQVVDVEKAAPVDLVVGEAPPGEPIMSVAPASSCRRARPCTVPGRKPQGPPGGERARSDVGARGKCGRNSGPRPSPFSTVELDLARGKRFAIGPPEERHQHLAAQMRNRRVSSRYRNIWHSGWFGRRAQHVHPPCDCRAPTAMWLGTMSTISPMPCAAQRRHQPPQAVLAAELGIDPRRIDHVVAVQRARPRGHDRRGIEVADAERRKIRHQRGRVGEGKARVELQSHGGARHVIAASPFEGREPALEPRRVKQRLGRRRHTPPPVRMFVDRAGKVRLLVEAERVFERQQVRARKRRLGDKFQRGVDDCRRSSWSDGWFAGRRLGAAERAPQRRAVPVAFRALPRRHRCQAERLLASRCRVPRHQPATVGRSCVDVIAAAIGQPAAAA